MSIRSRFAAHMAHNKWKRRCRVQKIFFCTTILISFFTLWDSRFVQCVNASFVVGVTCSNRQGIGDESDTLFTGNECYCTAQGRALFIPKSRVKQSQQRRRILQVATTTDINSLDTTKQASDDGHGEAEKELSPRNDVMDSQASSSGPSSVGEQRRHQRQTSQKEEELLHTPLGKWEYLHGNYVLRPSSLSISKKGPISNAEQPRALIHFLGGALVGAAPQITYRYLLEKLVEKNYLVVTTPYTLSFNHLQTCDEVLDKFERIAPQLAREYGAIPVIGVGHSLGSLLQLLITSLFPDTPRAGNIMMSYNKKDVKEAVPFFDEIFTPAFVALADDAGFMGGMFGNMKSTANETDVTSATPESDVVGGSLDSDIESDSEETSLEGRSSVEGLMLALRLARSATQGQLPKDNLLQDIARYVTPATVSNAVKNSQFAPPEPSIPTALRTALDNVLSPQVNTLRNYGFLPFMDQVLDIVDQIPPLILEVANGAREFVPPPSSVATAARRSYRARRTLLIQYDNDTLDETELIEEYLREAEQIMRMKRPMVSMDVQKKILEGNGHATPCMAPPLDVAERAEDILGKEGATEALMYKKVDETVEEMARWLEEAQL